ncbi:MAG: hypothetical protein A2126_00890 [Candidatus Woykebacteria bacterium GWB1_45_5]|uniref:Uncharacterized protein n=1 Tax=Candidatus Woykebacteria bacterium GWB1_45_5 TaxID=1802592 RepID=A0A1G1W9K3_9BACT|nr:MAG: hypothetical protein A2126_00890 [Candidatus Woykebacteria bacterium GWB1_45_5]
MVAARRSSSSEGGRPSLAPFYRWDRRLQAARASWNAANNDIPRAAGPAIQRSLSDSSGSVW